MEKEINRRTISQLLSLGTHSDKVNERYLCFSNKVIFFGIQYVYFFKVGC